jgi:hypothetical protein
MTLQEIKRIYQDPLLSKQGIVMYENTVFGVVTKQHYT